MSIDEARREAIINKLKELEEFLEPEERETPEH